MSFGDDTLQRDELDVQRINWLREEIARLHQMIQRRDEEIHRLLGQICLQAIYMTRD